MCLWEVYSLLNAVKNSNDEQLKGRSCLASGLQVGPSWYSSRNVSEVTPHLQPRRRQIGAGVQLVFSFLLLLGFKPLQWCCSPWMGFPAQLTESTNHKHAQRYISWVILALAKVTTNVNHHRQNLVLHNYSPDYLCSHGEGVCGNSYLCRFIPNITSVPRDLVP